MTRIFSSIRAFLSLILRDLIEKPLNEFPRNELCWPSLHPDPDPPLDFIVAEGMAARPTNEDLFWANRCIENNWTTEEYHEARYGRSPRGPVEHFALLAKENPSLAKEILNKIYNVK